MRVKNAWLLLVLAVFMVPGVSAQVYDIALSGSQQVPVNDSEASGNCVGYLNAAQDQLTVICKHDVENVTAAHIHRAPAGEIGPVLLPFPSAVSPIKGIFGVTAQDVADLRAGNLYVNVHSSEFPGGEIRGQIGPAADSGVYFPLEADQVIPPSTTDASGACMGALNALKSAFNIACTNDVEDITVAHIHRGAAGEDGPPVFFFEAGTTIIDTVRGSDFADCPDYGDFLDDLWWENLYVNVHSTAYPAGEIRGQIPAPPLPLYFPQFGNGEGFASSIVLTNSSTTSAASGTLYFVDSQGAPMLVGITGSGVIAPGEVSQVDFELAALGSVVVQTTGAGDLQVGSAKTVSDQPVGGIIRFAIPNIGIAGFGSGVPLSRAIVPARKGDGINTAIAIRNNESHPVVVNLQLRDPDGIVEGEPVDLTIPANGRIAQFIDEIFGDAGGEGFIGGIVIQTSDGSFSAIALELGAEAGQFTSLPVVPLVGP